MSRDTSAFTTLDNANMGTREDFRKWWKASGIEFASIFETGAAEKGWNARQPEIDALKEELAIRCNSESRAWAKLDKLTEDAFNNSIERTNLQRENKALKAKNERLRADAERYRWLKANCFDYEAIGPGEPIGQGGLVFASTEVTQLPDSLDSAIDAAMKDFSTQPKEE